MFGLSNKQWIKLHNWFKGVNKENAARQWANPEMRKHMIDENTPYAGASGGALTYSFTPTNLGTVVKVTEELSGKVIDLTEYEDW